MIDPRHLETALRHGFRPLPGRCIVELDELPIKSGHFYIPNTARNQKSISQVKGNYVVGDETWTGKVMAVTPRQKESTGELGTEEFQPGDRVLIGLLLEDLNQKVIVTQNSRVWAIVDK